ncbi:hypothetical protein E0Z10_g7308 [Xylaria hypoxylon]|uniref:PH domain-containing protein n=1 Tax=Xylaria hypoxylon TaxID=37992 RepID=A0A4Z0YQI4_9PEZI|nr:hypothetical protein E0Z10_g7308 [Xylaria hypoxylon]
MSDNALAASPAIPSPATVPKRSSPSIPVTLNEAGLDSPSFRASAVFFADQADSIERWLEGYVRTTSKLTHDILGLEETINQYLSKLIPPPAIVSVDHDYTALALKRIGDGSREWWVQVLNTAKKIDTLSVEPVRTFLASDLRNFKETKRTLEHAQKTYDSTLARYVSQSKTKEPSSLREDAFSVYETRKAYLKASLDFCFFAPQLRFNLDKLLVQVSADVWREMRKSRDTAGSFAKYSQEMNRVRGWSKEMELTESMFKRELSMARRDIGENTLANCKPSREIDDYSASTVPFLGSRGSMHIFSQGKSAVIVEKQGWLFLRTVYGKPSRTNWIRRWYYCRDGIFGWLVNGPQGVLQGDEIGVLLCNAKPAVQEERRFCFEVKTKNQTLLLQTETQAQLMEWLEVFEVAKKRAFEASVGRDTSLLPGGVDPAFSITPPSLPEFSAKSFDTQVDEAAGLERVGTLPIPGPDSGLVPRQTFDVNAAAPKRSATSLAREEGETGREHAARIMQKLDLHRKATFTSNADNMTMPSPGPSGGIASLISASHGLLPGYSGPSLNQASSIKPQQGQLVMGPEARPGSLAPHTLAKPPAATVLSRTAVAYSGERTLTSNPTQLLPTAIMANYWGSNAWGQEYSARASQTDVSSDDPFGPNSPSIKMTTLGDNIDPKSSSVTSLHKKAISMDAKMSVPKIAINYKDKPIQETFPPNYPTELKTNSAQFRLLFPSVPIDEKLVLVFRSAWISTSEASKNMPQMAGNGRIYVTSDNMYFYGHQMGLIVAYMISLDTITEVTAAPGRDCDFIFLHLSQDTNDTGYTRITIKTFLEDLDILHARLNLLIDDLQAEEPMDVPEIIKALIQMEKEGDIDSRSPSVDSWEEVSAHTPIDDGTAAGRSVSPRVGDFAYQFRKGSSRKPFPKFQLPTRPVIYEPEDTPNKVAERTFEISAKACFHVLFGDKSFIFPKLYFERRAQQIAQGPWKLNEAGNMHRIFSFKVTYSNQLGRSREEDIADHQTIEVFSDHVTYVVTHEKTPWHLPHAQDFKLVTKIVITHVAKSKCKLAIFTKVAWSKAPALTKQLVERQALDDASQDAEELAEVATDQVRRLGHHSRTKRAIQVYGNVGLQSQVVVFSPNEKDSARKPLINPRTLGSMLFETGRSFAESVASCLMLWTFAVLKKLWKIVSAQRLLILLLGLSVVTNITFSSQSSATWWSERRAANFMNRIGVGPNVMMSKAIYLADLDEAARSTSIKPSWPQNSYCYSTFQTIANSSSIDAAPEDAGSSLSPWSPSRSTARRLRRTRQKLGSYRHDLLVAMRLVNSVETEMLRSEWENWLVDENSRCEQVGAILQDTSSKTGGSKENSIKAQLAQKVLTNGVDNDTDKQAAGEESLRQWYEEYCDDTLLDKQPLDFTSTYTRDNPTILPAPIIRQNVPIAACCPHKAINKMSSAHEAFKALGPVEWESFAQEDPNTLLSDIFGDAHCLIDSIPNPLEDDSLPSQAAESLKQAGELRKQWKEVKLNPRDNPLELNIYKLAAKDGRGAWFARRSVHDGQSFKKWRTGMESEFSESLKVQGQPGDGKIRGLGADKCVIDQTVDGRGKIQVYQLSAQFPGPTAPRDFVTLFLTSDNGIKTPAPTELGTERCFMLVSKPCVHSECPERRGFVRGYYESVEFIRETKVAEPPRKTRSSADGAGEDASPSMTNGSDRVGEESAISNPVNNDQDDGPKGDEGESYEEGKSTIEWTMITRSDPGGSVPRFIIEKKTPEGIATDAGKFFQWISSEIFETLLNPNYESVQAEDQTTPCVVPISNTSKTLSNSISRPSNDPRENLSPAAAERDEPELPGPGGVYGMISGALSMVATAAASRLLGSPGEDESESEISTPDVSDGSSSIHSFHSLDATGDVEPPAKMVEDKEPAVSVSTSAGGDSSHSTPSSHQDKELRKLEERRKKTEDKLRRAEERALAKKNDDAQRDELALQKLREKHEREIAKQEERYQRERRKLVAKRAAEDKKAEERRRKQAEREDKVNLTLELDKVRAERDMARKEMDILKEQVGQLQALNTKLVTRLGREGINPDDDLTPGSEIGGLAPGNLARSVTEQDLGKKLHGVKS